MPYLGEGFSRKRSEAAARRRKAFSEGAKNLLDAINKKKKKEKDGRVDGGVDKTKEIAKKRGNRRVAIDPENMVG